MGITITLTILLCAIVTGRLLLRVRETRRMEEETHQRIKESMRKREK